MFKGFDIAADAKQEVNIVVAVEQAGFFIVVDLKCFGLTVGGDRLIRKVYDDGCCRVFFNRCKELLQKGFANGYGKEEVIQCVILDRKSVV